MNTKNNKRYRENEIHMETAMLDLLKTNAFEKITVKESAKRPA